MPMDKIIACRQLRENKTFMQTVFIQRWRPFIIYWEKIRPEENVQMNALGFVYMYT